MTGAEWRAYVEGRLEEAGVTLLCLRDRPTPLAVRTGWPPVVQEWTAYAADGAALAWPSPSARSIARMDEALAWLGWLPPPPDLARHVVGARMLVHPVRGDFLVSWRRLARALHTDHHRVQRAHARGVALIAAALEKSYARCLPNVPEYAT